MRASYTDETQRLIQRLGSMGLNGLAIVYLDNGFGREVLGDALKAMEGQGMKAVAQVALDTGGKNLAEVVNLFFLFMNTISDLKPALIPGLVTQFVDALDLYEVNDGLEQFFETVGEALIPLERVIVPKAVKHLCAVLAPRDDDYEPEAAEARNMLRALLLGEEVTV